VSRGGRGGGRPPVRKVASARVSRPVPRTPRVIVKPEGIRYIRADGTPNWVQWIPPKEGDVKFVASHPAVTAAPQSSILEVSEIIAERKVRGVVLAEPGKETLRGLVTATDLVNYLGGGEYYNIVVNRHKRNIFSALRDEPVESIANPTPLFVTVADKLDTVVELMISQGVGIVPVVYEDGSVYGVITEHDIVKHVAGKRTGVRVADAMSKNLVTVGIEDPIKEAARRMVAYGFRRLPVVSGSDEIKGMVTAKDYVSFFGSHRAFKELTSTDIEEVLSVPVYEIMTPEFYTIREDADVGEAAEAMMKYGTSSLLVVNEKDEIVGIITERDVLVSIASQEAPPTGQGEE